MKTRVLPILLAVGIISTLCTCIYDPAKKPEPQAELLSLKVGTRVVTAIPEPLPDKDWDNEDYIVGGMDTGRIVILSEGDTEGVIITPEVNPGATALWAVGSFGNRPGNFGNPRVPADFGMEDYLYIKVTADDGITSNYYRFGPAMASPVKELVNVTVAGRDPVKQSKAYASIAAAQADIVSPGAGDAGRIAITLREATGALVIGEPQDENAVLRYAYAERNTAIPTLDDFGYTDVYTDPDTEVSVNTFVHDFRTDNTASILYVEVTAQNETDVNYYAYVMEAGRMATIARLDLEGARGWAEVVGKGTEHGVFGSVLPGSFASADQKTDGFDVKITLNDIDGSYEYAKIASLNSAQPTTGWQKAGKLKFDHGNALAVRVSSARGNAGDVRYYKVQINLQAANFLAHPASAVYYYFNENTNVGPGADGAPDFDWYENIKLKEGGAYKFDKNDSRFQTQADVKPLSVTLDRTGNFSYQWYEANSWYGGYGFDKNGLIAWVDADGNTHREAGFITDDDHPGGLDEKNNVSLHNGGNQYYRLPVKGEPIPASEGGTSPTYTPPISRRPFIAGYSHESHYYWVVVTDEQGLKATSSRATVVVERDPRIKHHIVDLNAYINGGIGLQEPPKNQNAFTFKREKRIIPVTFPAGFNIWDYSVAVVQATFFLVDGTPWIQNWTQGDIGFEKDGAELVLYYNLTNNNATLGLSGDGKEPQGGSLEEVPSHLVVKPAGEKPPKQMPPLNSDGTPKEDGDAQGWFTPFIELVEVRFMGPARK
ncbi:MAG: hypothetical protein LBC52_06390 [Treponema sp.]|jgi:hypothetical protein|nr:hypothetical protein [Treponema sp.]